MRDDPFPRAELTTEQSLQDLIAGQRELLGLMVALHYEVVAAMNRLQARLKVDVALKDCGWDCPPHWRVPSDTDEKGS